MHSDDVFVQFAVLKLDSAWYSLGDTEKESRRDEALKLINSQKHIRVGSYALTGIEPEADIMLWLVSSSLEELQYFLTQLLKSGIGRYLLLKHSLIGLTGKSEYVREHDTQSQSLNSSERGKYIAVYPFIKTSEWYLLGGDERGEMMKEHVQIARGFKSIRQGLAYSFGLDDQEFVLSYETDDLREYRDLARALREARVRKYTLKETPVFLGVRRSIEEIIKTLW
ncbi:MAG: chlorite dismutase family protein [Candidatus Micrarchaeota archaeon]|nr:chlorite dismutase family protein [Candidatus Micrarchaeota archaeon]MDE1864404.1 chlorite dismutase family protein [Candidatus Micrarchaeota archaeon]